MDLQLSNRDLRVLVKCAVCKWLSTSQLHRLCYPDVSPDAVRKSLRRLAEAKYLASNRANRMTEALHALGPKGKAVLAAKGFHRVPSRIPPQQLEHLRGVNDIRIAFEQHPERVAFFFSFWELGGVRWPYTVIPDAVMALRLPNRVSFLVEYDRSTEGTTVLANKVRSYEDFPALDPTILIVADTEKRLALFSRTFRVLGVPRLLLGAVLTDMVTQGAYSDTFMDLFKQQPKLSLAEAVRVDP